MAAFPTPEAALGAARAMQDGFERWCRERGVEPALVLKIGFHAGPAVAVTANGRLDDFGRTVNLAARIQKQAAGRQVALTEALWESFGGDAGGAEPPERFEARLPGIDRPGRLGRLGPAAP